MCRLVEIKIAISKLDKIKAIISVKLRIIVSKKISFKNIQAVYNHQQIKLKKKTIKTILQKVIICVIFKRLLWF